LLLIPELSTDRLNLKVLQAEDATKVVAYYLRNQEFLADWEPVRSAEFFTEEFQKKQLAKDFELMHKGRMMRLWIFKKGNNRVIGCISLNNIIRGIFQSAHLGYKLDQAEINQGLMTEALEKIIEFAFYQLRLHRLEANIMPRNERSQRVVEKLGFHKEGLAKRYLQINGVWEDHIHFVILNENG